MIDPTITIGDLILLTGFLLAGIMAFANIKIDIAEMRVKVDEMWQSWKGEE